MDTLSANSLDLESLMAKERLEVWSLPMVGLLESLYPSEETPKEDS